MRSLILLSLFSSVIFSTDAFLRKRYNYGTTGPLKTDSNQDYGDPVFLSPFIDANQLDEAKEASRVNNLPGAENITSYAGYLTVNKDYDSNMFFWFFPNQNKSAPILLWLQGGPGGSSMFGLFVENGPILIQKDLSVIRREYAWTKEFHMIFIDNPVGTGFSFTKNDDGYSNNESEVADNLFSALTQFFTVFHEYQQNEFYLTGESYAGKYLPAIGYKIMVESMNCHISRSNRVNFNLVGLAIGDGLCDPATQSDYASLLYQIGLLDEREKINMTHQQNEALKAIREERFIDAFKIFDALIDGDLINGTSYFKQVTGLSDYFNFLNTELPAEHGYYAGYLALPEVRKAIHVGQNAYNDGKKVEEHLMGDIMQSVKPWVSALMDRYRVILYSGQLDVIVAPVLSENFISHIKWKGAKQYFNAQKYIYRLSPDDKNVAGYVRKVVLGPNNDFYQVILRNGGHILPFDQPQASYKLISDFINRRL